MTRAKPIGDRMLTISAAEVGTLLRGPAGLIVGPALTQYPGVFGDLSQALAWVNKAVETNKDAFWMYMLKARIHAKQNDKAS